jgi:hypothetical protein
MATGMVACGIALGWYNYVRFGNPMEFGTTYRLASFSLNPRSAEYATEPKVDAVLRSAREFLFVTPQVDTNMPFLHTVLINPLAGRSGPPLWTEGMVGLIPVAPFVLLGWLTPLILRKRVIASGLLDGASAWLLNAMYWSALGVFVVLCIIGWVVGRYLVDFAPVLTFEGTLVSVMLWQTLRTRLVKYLFSSAVSAIVIYGALSNVALATPTVDQIVRFLRR